MLVTRIGTMSRWKPSFEFVSNGFSKEFSMHIKFSMLLLNTAIWAKTVIVNCLLVGTSVC